VRGEVNQGALQPPCTPLEASGGGTIDSNIRTHTVLAGTIAAAYQKQS